MLLLNISFESDDENEGSKALSCYIDYDDGGTTTMHMHACMLLFFVCDCGLYVEIIIKIGQKIIHVLACGGKLRKYYL
jgi:hypothetical protein